MLPIVLALALAAPEPVRTAGPTLPPIKGLVKPMAQGSGTKGFVDFSMKEMGQAVVVVEGEMPKFVAKIDVPSLKLFDGKLKLFRPVMPLPNQIPAAPWMDLTTAGAPGNPVSKSFPLGWGY